jgi:hypothetical protein
MVGRSDRRGSRLIDGDDTSPPHAMACTACAMWSGPDGYLRSQFLSLSLLRLNVTIIECICIH